MQGLLVIYHPLLRLHAHEGEYQGQTFLPGDSQLEITVNVSCHADGCSFQEDCHARQGIASLVFYHPGNLPFFYLLSWLFPPADNYRAHFKIVLKRGALQQSGHGSIHRHIFHLQGHRIDFLQLGAVVHEAQTGLPVDFIKDIRHFGVHKIKRHLLFLCKNVSGQKANPQKQHEPRDFPFYFF